MLIPEDSKKIKYKEGCITLISGAAGSGKTLLARSIMKDFIQHSGHGQIALIDPVDGMSHKRAGIHALFYYPEYSIDKIIDILENLNSYGIRLIILENIESVSWKISDKNIHDLLFALHNFAKRNNAAVVLTVAAWHGSQTSARGKSIRHNIGLIQDSSYAYQIKSQVSDKDFTLKTWEGLPIGIKLNIETQKNRDSVVYPELEFWSTMDGDVYYRDELVFDLGEA